MKLTLDTNLCELSSDEAIDIISDFLTKIKVPFRVKKNFQSQLNKDPNLIDITHFYIEKDDDSIRLGLENYDSYIKLRMMYLGPKIEGRLSDDIKVETPQDIIKVISTFMPELTNDKVFKKINENSSRLSITSEFSSMEYSETLDHISNFLDKSNIEYKLVIDGFFSDYKSFHISNDNSDGMIVIDVKKKKEEDKVRGFKNPDPEINCNYYTDKSFRFGIDHQKNWLKSLVDVSDFISIYMPELVTNRVFKKINESNMDIKIDLTKMNIKETISNIHFFLNKIKILYKYHKIGSHQALFNINDNNSIQNYILIYYTDINTNIIGGYQKNNDSILVDHVINTPKDIIDFISKNSPNITNDSVFKKINENNIEETEKDVIRKFLKYVSNLSEWNDTNENMYEMEKDWEIYSDESELFSDDNYHNYRLYGVWDYELESNENDESILTLDDSIEYFICGFYGSYNETSRDLHVYKNGEFIPAIGDEDSYLRGLDDEIYLSDQEEIIIITYDDWKKNKEVTFNAMKKINEIKFCTSFNKFKLIYKI